MLARLLTLPLLSAALAAPAAAQRLADDSSSVPLSMPSLNVAWTAYGGPIANAPNALWFSCTVNCGAASAIGSTTTGASSTARGPSTATPDRAATDLIVPDARGAIPLAADDAAAADTPFGSPVLGFPGQLPDQRSDDDDASASDAGASGAARGSVGGHRWAPAAAVAAVAGGAALLYFNRADRPNGEWNYLGMPRDRDADRAFSQLGPMPQLTMNGPGMTPGAVTTTTAPEPGTVALLLVGLAGVVAVRKRSAVRSR